MLVEPETRHKYFFYTVYTCIAGITTSRIWLYLLSILEEENMKILTPTDGSVAAHKALMTGAEYAKTFGGELHILTVVPRITPMASPIDGFPHEYMYQDLEAMEKSYQRILQYSVQQVKEKYPDLKVTPHLKVGRPSQTIVDKSEELDVDMVVMGSRGLGGITGWVLGSTSKKVVDQCKRQVLVIK